MRRIDSLRVIADHAAERPLIVTCGATARELASLERRDSHLPLLDSMGLAAAVAAGIALAYGGAVTAVEGDGSLLMGLTILPTLATQGPANLTVVVLDNHQHASAGGLPTQAAEFELAAAIAGFGLPVRHVRDEAALRDALDWAEHEPETAVVVGEIERGNAADIPFLLEDPAAIAARFKTALKPLSGVSDGTPDL